jgi:hypothetical protein
MTTSEKVCKLGKVPKGKKGRCVTKKCKTPNKVPTGIKRRCVSKKCKSGKVHKGKDGRCIKPKSAKKSLKVSRKTTIRKTPTQAINIRKMLDSAGNLMGLNK